jgi:two-component system, sensor histidine kinase and response regulator
MGEETENLNPTILVVDDTQDNLDLLEFALRRKPVKMLRAASGFECLDIAREQNPDVILLDIQMPGMDGFETLKRLREEDLTAKIPVILLTAQKKDPVSIEKGLQLGADLYLTKPIDTEELLVRTRMLIRIRRAEDELDRIKADFMAMLVHDMRNPILIIKSFLELLMEDENMKLLSEDLRMIAVSALTSSSTMLNLINDILDLSKYESGNVPLQKLPQQIVNVVDDVLQQMVIQSRQKNIIIQKHIAQDLPQVLIDGAKMGQALMNIVGNALKFTPSGGIIKVSAEYKDRTVSDEGSAEPAIQIAVSDSGVGIPAEELPHVFDRYKQLSTAGLIRQKGTGLGLAICKLIIDAHGGKIKITSEVGKGTTVKILIPLTKGQEA